MALARKGRRFRDGARSLLCASQALLMLQPLIPLAFWAAICAVSCCNEACPGLFKGLSFHAADRHLRRGCAHAVRSPDARSAIGLEFLIGHGVPQSLFALLLSPRADIATTAADSLKLLLGLTGGWAALVSVAAAGAAPHELPYHLGRVPAALRWDAAGCVAAACCCASQQNARTGSSTAEL